MGRPRRLGAACRTAGSWKMSGCALCVPGCCCCGCMGAPPMLAWALLDADPGAEPVSAAAVTPPLAACMRMGATCEAMHGRDLSHGAWCKQPAQARHGMALRIAIVGAPAMACGSRSAGMALFLSCPRVLDALTCVRRKMRACWNAVGCCQAEQAAALTCLGGAHREARSRSVASSALTASSSDAGTKPLGTAHVWCVSRS